VLALDFFNGNRTPYADYSLKGMLIGMTLATRPEEIYRALIEATAFGTRRILELYRENGIEIKEVLASGGIAKKNPFLMQVYADVCGMPIRVMESSEAAARGSCLLGALGAGCFPSAEEAARVLGDRVYATYVPHEENTRAYDGLYEEYVRLGEYFAKENGVMRRLGDVAQ
jgi:L-ribulokinase